MARRAVTLLGCLLLAAIAAPWLAPYDASRSFRDYLHAPPMPPRPSAGLAVYPITLVDRLDQRYAEDRTRTIALPWTGDGQEPVFLLGADSFGRDILSRLLAGTRLSLGLGLLAVLGAMVIGALAGAWAGARGGWVDDVVMRAADFILVLPAIYVALVLRAALPLVLPLATIFVLLAAIFAAVGWPFVARGVRAIVAREREQEYVMAARSIGASRSRVLLLHLLPACAGQMAVHATLLLPAFILAEATLSYVGLGFPDTAPSWGTMLAEAGNVSALARFPWTLAPAAAIFAVTLATNLTLQRQPEHPTPYRSTRPTAGSPDPGITS